MGELPESQERAGRTLVIETLVSAVWGAALVTLAVKCEFEILLLACQRCRLAPTTNESTAAKQQWATSLPAQESSLTRQGLQQPEGLALQPAWWGASLAAST